MMSGQAGARHYKKKKQQFFIVVNSCGAADISKASAASRGWASGVVTFKKMAETLARANFFKKLRLWADLLVFLIIRGEGEGGVGVLLHNHSDCKCPWKQVL